MERVFGVPVINLYGSSETGHLLVEFDPRIIEYAVHSYVRRPNKMKTLTSKEHK
jgi:hypothetical protein